MFASRETGTQPAAWREKQERAHEAMVRALPWPSALRNKLGKCGQHGHWAWNEWRCGSPACFGCSRRYAGREARKIVSALPGASNSDLSMVTIMIGIADDVDEIGDCWAKFKSDIRNKFNSLRRSDRSWGSVSLTGWLEADPISFDDFALLGSNQIGMLASLNTPRWRSDGKPAWVAHIHAVAAHRGLDSEHVRTGLASRWPGERQVHVKPFQMGKCVSDNVMSVVRYSTKIRSGRWVRGSLDTWPPPWLAEYYAWADWYSRGWQSLRLRINPVHNLYE